ncbi:MAG: hypothetical protein ACREIA_05835 [Opitutaceae bacterium]
MSDGSSRSLIRSIIDASEARAPAALASITRPPSTSESNCRALNRVAFRHDSLNAASGCAAPNQSIHACEISFARNTGNST